MKEIIFLMNMIRLSHADNNNNNQNNGKGNKTKKDYNTTARCKGSVLYPGG